MRLDQNMYDEQKQSSASCDVERFDMTREVSLYLKADRYGVQ